MHSPSISCYFVFGFFFFFFFVFVSLLELSSVHTSFEIVDWVIYISRNKT